MKIPDKVLDFISGQSFVIVSTIDSDGRIHCSAKGIAGIHKDGRIFVIDLYHNRTYRNLQNNPGISITQVDERSFAGYTLQGKAKIVSKDKIDNDYIKEWGKRVLKRMSGRLVKSVQSEKASIAHYEARLPEEPKYLIEIDVENIVDLSPFATRM